MIRIFRYMKLKEVILIAVSTVFIMGQVWLNLRLPDYMAEITSLVQTEGSAMRDVWIAGAWMLSCAFGVMILASIVGLFAARVATVFAKELRKRVFDKTLEFSMEEINNFSTASLITRSTNDITQIQQILAMGIQVMIMAPILAVWAIVKILGKGWEWSLATGIGVLILLAMISFLVIFALPKFKVIQKLTDNLNRITREHLIGVRVVHAYNAEDYQASKFEKASDELMATNLFVNRAMAIMNPAMSLIMSGLTLAIYWIGAYLINNAGMMDRIDLFSNMVVFSSYAMQVIMAFMLLSMTFIMLPRAAVSAKRINEVLDTPLSILDGTVESSKENTGEVEFKNVSFKYPDAEEYILEDINFKASQGETVAFIGSTGSGKSTLINLIPRFFDATEGEVLVDGVNVKDYKLEALNNKLGYVSQKAILFSGTVKSNVAYGHNGEQQLTELGVKRAVEIAQGKEFVEKMEGAYDAPIAQGGTNVSGGQKQRLSIARAVGKNPKIFIFDDSFSALDYKTDRVLRSVLKKETTDATTLIVAQRIGTIKDADKIIVLDEGKIVGMGSHYELLKNCQTYQEIAYSQLSEEELNNE